MHRFNDNLVHWNSNEELLRALVAENVDFVLIGGLAIAWYCESRQADDMDLLVKPTAENAERIRKALSSVNVQGFDAAAFAGAGAQLQIRDRYYAELLTPALGGPAYEEIAQASEPAKLFGTPIRVWKLFCTNSPPAAGPINPTSSWSVSRRTGSSWFVRGSCRL